ncbi:gpW family protein [Escherichia coli]|uniref:phage head-tail joining protein n=1 Tax=Escherichia coli TaxID=562 RepID=UPI000542B364|nr:gpW family head-tail joining protein [Escherichia coli]EHY8047143.1 gpW family protein [Escherichia coli O157]EKF4355466.1 gpW family protein [Escherichia coli O136]ANP06980.1 phage tail protein [Escherichia coli]EET7295694.1 phage tail protein [Escherichia coli]EET7399057.1 phage tail protein [Escherichia coli]
MIYTHEMLCDARMALHELMIGRAVVSVSKDGRQVQYSRATIGELRQYIEEMESALGVSGRRRGPAGVGL